VTTLYRAGYSNFFNSKGLGKTKFKLDLNHQQQQTAVPNSSHGLKTGQKMGKRLKYEQIQQVAGVFVDFYAT
jgi:hypothetical protein